MRSFRFALIIIPSWPMTTYKKGRFTTGKNIKSQFFKNNWRLMYQIWLTFCIYQEHGSISASGLMEDLCFKFHKDSCFQTTCLLKQLDQFQQNFTWRISGYMESSFVQVVPVFWQRWLIWPYIFKCFQKYSSVEALKQNLY